MKKCPYCGAEIEENKAVCPECGEKQPVAAYQNSYEKSENSFFEKFIYSVKDLVFNPKEFFDSLTEKTNVLSAFYYFFTVILISSLFNSIWSISMMGNMRRIMSQYGEEFGNQAFAQGFYSGVGSMSIITVFLRTLIFGVIGIFIVAAIAHLILVIFGEGKYGFENTIKAFFFGYTPNLLVIIPFCGSMIGSIWAIVLTIIGVAHLQKTSYGKAAASVLSIIILCCFIGLLFAGSMAAIFKNFG